MNPKRIVWLALGGLFLASAVNAADEQRFESGGVGIRYFIDGAGEPLVLIHGFSGSATTAWLNPGVFDALVDAGFRVIALDNRGHGGSDKPHDPASYGVEMAEDIRRLLDHLDIERAHIVGYSMGAKIANTFRARHPDRLTSLTLGGYGWPWQGPTPLYADALAAMRKRTLPPGNEPEALAAYRVASAELLPGEENLRANRIPTLSIVGTEDAAVPADDLRTLRTTMARVTAVDMPGTHAGTDGVLYKAEFAEAVVEFIRRETPRQP